jgi:hypothetical protein
MDPDDHKKGVMVTEQQDNSELEGFEYYLTEIQKIVDEFDEDDAKLDMAMHKEFPTDGSFSGRLMCGFDKYKGKRKKDGTPMWGCSAKWSQEFYAVLDKKGKIIRSYSLDDYDQIEYDEDCEKLVIKEYKGCPAWNR